MKKLFLKFWPLIFIFIIWFIFANPYFIKSKAPFSASYQLNNFAPWSAYPEFAGPVKNGAMPDVITQIYPWRHLVIQIWKSGQVPLWNPYSFAGTPLLANYQSAALSPFNLVFFVLPFVDGWSVLVLLQTLLAGIFTYVFVRSLKRSQIASLISSVSFMFCGFITTWMDYGTLAFAILFLPLALFSIEKYYSEGRSRFLALLSLSIPLSFFSGHFQISIYFLIVVVSYALYKLIETKDSKKFLGVTLFIFFGLLMSAPQILPSVEFYNQSFRSDNFQKGEVIPWKYLPTLLAPDFFGNPVTRNDWFGHYAEWNGFIGFLPLVFAVFAITFKKKSKVMFFFIVGIVSMFLAFDSRLVDLMVSLRVPVLSTSAASRIIVIYSFSFAVLSAFGFDQMTADIKANKLKKIIILFLFFLLLLGVVWFLSGHLRYIPWQAITIARNNLKLPSLIFSAGLITIALTSINKKLLYFCSLLVLVVISFDMLRFVMKWQEFSPKEQVFKMTPTGKAFENIAGYSRVIGNFGGEAAVYYNLPSLEGYDALYIKRYGEFASSAVDGKLRQAARSVVSFPIDSPNTKSLINLLDVKYVVHKFADGRFSWTFPFWTYPDGQFTQIYQDNSYEFFQNNKTFPHAFLVGEYVVEKNSQKIIDILTSEETNLRRKIVLEENPSVSQSNGEIGAARIIKYSPNEIEIAVQAVEPGLLFLSDNYYKGWKAMVDNVEQKIYRADYSFRAVPIEKGNHTVSFVYEPISFVWGFWLAVSGIVGIIFIFLYSKFGVRKFSSSS